MRTTGRSRSDIPTGTSTEVNPEWLSSSVQSRIAVALLTQAVRDLAGKDMSVRVAAARWLNSDGCREVAAAIPVEYSEVWEATKDITFRPPAQRTFLAREFIKTLPKK